MNNSIQQNGSRIYSKIRYKTSNIVDNHIILLMLGPGILAIFAIFIYPVFQLFYLSFHLATGGGVWEAQFVGFQNFETLFTSSEFWTYLKQTLIYSFGSLIVSASAGLILALAINKVKNSWVRTTYGTLVLVAWAIPVVVTSLMWRWILQGQNGVLNMILLDIGLLNEPYAWLAHSTSALVSVTLVDAWVRTPFATVIILAGLQSIPESMYDAAKVDGATVFQQFRNVTIPYLRPSFAIVGLINWMFAFRAFSIIWPLTGGGPGDATDVFATYIYKQGISLFRQGYASAIAVFLVVVSLIMAISYVFVVMEEVE